MPQLRTLVFRVPAVEAVAERVDTLFGAGFLFVPARPAEGGIKTVFVQRLLQPFGFHDVGMLGAAVHERVNAHRHPFRVFMHQQLAAVGFGGTVAEFVHLTEFPASIHMQQRERQRARIKGFTRQVQHHAGVFTDGVHHDRVSEFSSHFADDMDTFRFELPQVSQSFLVHNRSLSQSHHRRAKAFCVCGMLKPGERAVQLHHLSHHDQGGHGGVFRKVRKVL